MIAAMLTTILFAIKAVFARPGSLELGSASASFPGCCSRCRRSGRGHGSCGHGLVLAFGKWFFSSGLAVLGLGGLLMFQDCRGPGQIWPISPFNRSRSWPSPPGWLWLGRRSPPDVSSDRRDAWWSDRSPPRGLPLFAPRQQAIGV